MREAAPAAPPSLTSSPILAAWVAADVQSLSLLNSICESLSQNSPVLICGETGCGKDLLAEILHYAGNHRDAPLVRLDCCSFPLDLIEPELFGGEMDAFSITAEEKPGRLELAAGGTLIINEIAALPLQAQEKLLRVIGEQRETASPKGRRPVRIIALSTVDLERAVARRAFREDLFSILRESQLLVPPLRERPADIRPLAYRFLGQLKELHRKPQTGFSAAALEALGTYSYPANVRELRNIVEHAVVYGASPEILLQDLPPLVRGNAVTASKKMTLEELERNYIAEVLDYTRGKKTLAASVLGISRKTLLEKRKRYGLG